MTTLLIKFCSIRYFRLKNLSEPIHSCLVSNFSSEGPRKMSFEDYLEESKVQLVDIFNAAVRAVQPASIVENNVKIVGNELKVQEKTYPIDENVYIVGFGKAVMGMAAKMEEKLGNRLKRGIVSIPRGSRDHKYRLRENSIEEDCFPNFHGPIDYRESSYDNQPDNDTLMTSHDIIDLAESLNEKDTLVVLISGGGSALFYMPRPTIGSDSKLRLCKSLQNAGANIKELNTVRKKLSMVKGGGLALMAYPARVVTLILSDVVGDPVDLIASGPTVYSDKSPERVLSILKKYNLTSQIDGDLKNIVISKEVKINEKALLNAKKEFKHVDNFIIGNNALAMNAASLQARKKGFDAVLLRNDVVGNVRKVSEWYAKFASVVCRALDKEIEKKDFYRAVNSDELVSLSESRVEEIFDCLENSTNLGIIFIGGGEPEVVVEGSGLGGRNQELALSFSLDFYNEVKKFPQLTNYEVILLSAGTDGQDGPTDATGAFGYPAIDPLIKIVLKKLRQMSNKEILSAKDSKNSDKYKNSEISRKLRIAETIIPCDALANNDSYTFYSRFRKGKDLLKTGITGTNVMDLHILLVRKRQCDCILDFEKEEFCPDPLEYHNLCEDTDEEASKLVRKQDEIEDRKVKLLNLQILDSSLSERCCEKNSD